ncbi:ligase-associated DNA damage response endonuclease PdeM [bacterium SCSIO 12741]|nr:ligase-associated DNA damage response endonuclease PdeM [bacterium SCSIO 12741]
MYLRAEVAGESLDLLPDKAVFWPDQKALLIADPHFGKAEHFNRAGIQVPKGVKYQNWQRLFRVLHLPDLEEVIFMGDLFHSDFNNEWKDFEHIMAHFPHITFHLVLGNHDIFPEEIYHRSGLVLHESMKRGPFHFTHEPEPGGEGYNLAGHIHPAVRLKGAGRQSLRLPCFFFGRDHGILPAFGTFTGTYTLKPKKGDRFYAIADNEVINLS